MSIDVKGLFHEWIEKVIDDLNVDDIDHLRQLVEMIEFNETPRIAICGRGTTSVPIEIIKQLNEIAEVARVDKQLELHILADERRYMAIFDEELKPKRQGPFWAQRGKRSKGKRGRY